MQNLIARLIPNFLRRLDHYFLTHHRLIWITKTHYVLFYALVISLLSGVVIYNIPVSKANFYEASTYVIITGMAMFIGFSLWLLQQVSFGVEKDHGELTKVAVCKQFLLQLFTVTIFITVPILNGIIGEYQIARLLTDNQLVKDINTLNQGNVFFPTSGYLDNVHKNSLKIKSYHKYNFIYFKPNVKGAYQTQTSEEIELGFLRTQKNKQIQLKRIQDYISVAREYGLVIQKSPESVYQAFTNQEEFITLRQKSLIKSKIQDIAEAKSKRWFGINKAENQGFVVLLIWIISITTNILQQLSPRNFLISTAVALIMLLVGASFFGIMASILNMSFSDVLMIWFLFNLLIITCAFLTHFLSKYSRFNVICIVLLMVKLPFLALEINMFTAELFNFSFIDSIGVHTVMLVFSIIVSIGFFVFKNLLIKAQSLPK